jgi:mannose-6-phosphate isomerase-like protein (cupin superfamily)
MRDTWSLIATNEEPRKPLFDTGDLGGYAISLDSNGELKTEIHPDATQFFLVISGEGECTIDGKNDQIRKNSMFYVPRGKAHSVKANKEGLKMLTLYAPATHHTDTK